MGNLYLCKPGGVILGTMSGLDENTVSLQKSVGIWELTFEVNRFLYINGEFKETTFYNFISERMELYLDIKDTRARFVISSEPSVSNDGIHETKTVTASSIEYELQDKILRLFDINTGQKISQENLLRDDEGHEYNINPYTQLPIDYITVHRNYVSELTALKEQIDNGYLEWNYMETDEGTIETEMKHFVLQFGSDGTVTAENDTENIFPKYISNLISTYPRLFTNVIYGIDHRTNSKTLNQEIAVTETYLMVNKKTVVDNNTYIYEDVVKIPFRKFIYEDGNIMDATTISIPSLSESFSKLITFYQAYGKQLSMLELAIEKTNAAGWTVGNIPEHIARKKYSFSVDGVNVYAFLTNTCANTMKVVFDFDRVNKKINIIDTSGEDKDHDTGVFIGFENLANQIDIQTSSEDGIRTLFRPKGANNIGIEYVNFGEDNIINLDYFMHRTDGDGEYQFVSDELSQKYDAWKSFRDNEEITINDIPEYDYNLRTKEILNPTTITKTYSSRREAYTDLTKRYNKAMMDINKFIELLPNDGCSIDYTTFPFEDLVTAWTAYTNALDALLELYKNDYNVKEFHIDTLEAYDPVGNPCTSIKDTMYWLDFASYVYTIIPNVENALKIYVATDSEGNFLPESKDENGNWVKQVGGNQAYNTNAEMVTENMFDEYLYDMSLYGQSELEIKRRIWADAAAQLYRDGFILEYNEDGTPKTYNTADENGWKYFVPETHTFFPTNANIRAKYVVINDNQQIIYKDYNYYNTNHTDPFTINIPNWEKEENREEGYLYYLETKELSDYFDPDSEEPTGVVPNVFNEFFDIEQIRGRAIRISFNITNTNNFAVNYTITPYYFLGSVSGAIAEDTTITLGANQSYKYEFASVLNPDDFWIYNNQVNIGVQIITNKYDFPRQYIYYRLDEISVFVDIRSIKLVEWNGTLYYNNGEKTQTISGTSEETTLNYYSEVIKDDIRYINSFTGYDDFLSKMNAYLDYVSFEERDNSITKKHTKGVIQMAVDELAKVNPLIEQLKSYQDTCDSLRKQIADSVLLDNWNFNEKDLSIIYNLITESDYSNEYILSTNLDDIVTMVDIHRELYEDSSRRLYEKSRPQFSFTVNIDNLLSIDEFKNVASSIDILNYIYLKLGINQNDFTRLRIVGINYNPLIHNAEIEISFSNMIYQLDGISDLESLFSDNMGTVSSGGSSSGSGSSSGGMYGTNDAEIQISNNMLNALLMNNGYNASLQTVTDRAVTNIANMLIDGELYISGTTNTDTLKSLNYNGTNNSLNNTTGSIIRLNDGSFSFGGGVLAMSATGRLSLISRGTNDTVGMNNGELTFNGIEQGTQLEYSLRIASAYEKFFIRGEQCHSIGTQNIMNKDNDDSIVNMEFLINDSGDSISFSYDTTIEETTDNSSEGGTGEGEEGAGLSTEEIIKTTYAVPWLIYSKIQYSRETVNPNTQEKQNYSIAQGLNIYDKTYHYADIDMGNHSILNQSDIRLKKDIKDTNINSLSIINNLNFKEYDYIEDNKHINLGLIAQDLQKICPELVSEDKNGMLSIKTTDLIYYALKGIQEQQKQIEELKDGIINCNS